MMKFTEKLKNLAYLTPLYDWFGKRSFAQSGEDLIVWGELKNSRTQGIKNSRQGREGFYVDVGAYHPKLFSNTYLFYKKGWRGICVEPNPEMEALFKWARPRDTFLNLGVGGVQQGVSSQEYRARRLLRGRGMEKMMEYFEFEDGAANTFSAVQARKNIVEAGRRLKGKTNIKIKTLKSILDKNLPKGQKIDLLSVDVEGMDEEVLRSNDWKKYRPRLIIAEDLGFEFDGWMGGVQQGVSLQEYRARRLLNGKEGSGVVKFLNSVGYSLVAKTPYSLIFRVVK